MIQLSSPSLLTKLVYQPALAAITGMFWLILVLSVSFLFAQQTQPKMSHEETVVRQTYAKIAYANDVWNIQQQIQEYDLKGKTPNTDDTNAALSQVGQEHVQFFLADFKVGNIADIKGNYEEYVSEPKGEDVLEVNQTGFSITEGDKTVEGELAQIKWVTGQNTSADWKVPAVKWLSAKVDGHFYQRYAAYRVIVKYQGRERDYRALALFGSDEPNQPEQAFFVDLVTGNSALDHFAKVDVTPVTLTQTNNQTNPIAKAWLRKNSQPPSTPHN